MALGSTRCLHRSCRLPVALATHSGWSLTKTELSMLERTQQNLENHYLSPYLLSQPNFAVNDGFSQYCLPCPTMSTVFPSFYFCTSCQLPPSISNGILLLQCKKIIPSIKIQLCYLPSLNSILSSKWNKLSWKRFIKEPMLASEYSLFLDACSYLPLSDCKSS